jgi:hypothetical protein
MPRRLAFVDTVMEPYHEVGPPGPQISTEKIRELHEQGLEWEPLGELGGDRAPYTHVVRLLGPKKLSGRYALVELEPEA